MAATSPATAGGRQLWLLVTALGLTMIISWGQLFYSMAVLWPAVSTELGVSRTAIFLVVSLTLLVNGLVSPAAGRAIDLHSGRTMMCIGSIVAALAFAVLAHANSYFIYLVGWLIGGVAMSLTMYDPAFATLSQHAGGDYRRAMTAVTLLGGLASTAFWPLTAWIQSIAGWRGVFLAFVAMQLLVCLPLHALLIPRRVANRHDAGPKPSVTAPVASATQAAAYRWLAAAFCLHAYVMSVMAVHLLSMLQARGLTLAQAVSVGMVIGPMQVAGRIIDITFADRLTPRLVGTGALALITFSMLLLVVPQIELWVAFLIAALWGSGNGLITIAKGISVAEVFGRDDYGAWMGRLARWTFGMHAVAPASFAWLLAVGMGYTGAGWLLASFAGAALACYALAMRRVERQSDAG